MGRTRRQCHSFDTVEHRELPSSSASAADACSSSSSIGHVLDKCASPAAVSLVKAIWRHVQLAAADAQPEAAVCLISNNSVACPSSSSSSQTSSASNGSASSTSAAEGGNPSATTSAVQQQQPSSAAFSVALEGLMDVLVAIPSAAYHVDVAGVTALMAVLGNNYESDSAVPTSATTAASAATSSVSGNVTNSSSPSSLLPSGGTSANAAPPASPSLAAVNKTPQSRPATAPSSTPSLAATPAKAGSAAPTASSGQGAAHLPPTPAALAASLLSLQPRQAQWHRAWLQMLRLCHLLVAGAAPKFLQPVTAALASSRRAAVSLTGPSGLSAFLVGKAQRPTAEQCLELSMVASLVAALVRTRHGSGGAFGRAFPAAAADCDVSPLYAVARRAFIWLSVHARAFRKPLGALMVTCPPHASSSSSTATTSTSDGGAPQSSTPPPSAYAVFAARDAATVLADLTTVLLSAPIVAVGVPAVASAAANCTIASSGGAPSVSAAPPALAPFATHCLSLAPHEGMATFAMLLSAIQTLADTVRRHSRRLHLLAAGAANSSSAMSATATPRAVGLGSLSTRGASPVRNGGGLSESSFGASSSSLLVVHEQGDEAALMGDLAAAAGLLRQLILLYVAHWQYFASAGVPPAPSSAASSAAVINSINVPLPAAAQRIVADAQERLSSFVFSFSRDFLEDGHIRAGLPTALDALLRTLELVVLLFEATADRQ